MAGQNAGGAQADWNVEPAAQKKPAPQGTGAVDPDGQ